MNARIEIDMNKTETPEAKDASDFQRGPFIDVPALCRREKSKFIQYKEEKPGQEKVPVDQREYRVAFILFEQGMETGLRFYRKREMAEALCAFSTFRLVPRNRVAGLVEWGGRRGYKIVTVMSEEKRKVRARQLAEQEAMSEASRAGEMESLKSGRGKVKAVAGSVDIAA